MVEIFFGVLAAAKTYYIHLEKTVANIFTLQKEVDGGKSISLMSSRSDSIASALRLHTRVNQTGNNEKFAVFFHDINDVGLFNSMLFKDMVAN